MISSFIIFSICYFQEEVLQVLNDHWTIYKKRSEAFPRLPKPLKSHVPRYTNKN